MITKQEQGEICQAYRLAKDKEEQVKVLAELHATSTAEIRGILRNGGVYPFGPMEIADAATLIIEKGIPFASLRNYRKNFSEISAKQAKKIFKDYAYNPWKDGRPENDGEEKEAKDLVEKALTAAEERAKNRGKEHVPAPVKSIEDKMKKGVAFSDAENNIIVAGLIMVLAENKARDKTLNYTIEQLHAEADKALREAAEKMQELNQLREEIAKTEMLLEKLKEMNEAAAG